MESIGVQVDFPEPSAESEATQQVELTQSSEANGKGHVVQMKQDEDSDYQEIIEDESPEDLAYPYGTMLCMNVLDTLFVCPVGLLGVYFSLGIKKANKAGNYKRARQCAKYARFSITAAWIIVFFTSLALVLYFTLS